MTLFGVENDPTGSVKVKTTSQASSKQRSFVIIADSLSVASSSHLLFNHSLVTSGCSDYQRLQKEYKKRLRSAKHDNDEKDKAVSFNRCLYFLLNSKP